MPGNHGTIQNIKFGFFLVVVFGIAFAATASLGGWQ